MKLLLLSFIIPVTCLSQSATFSPIRLKPLSENYNVDSTTIIYPIVKLDNKDAAENINKLIRNTLLDDVGDEDSLTAIDSALRYRVDDGLITLSFEAIHNSNAILSLQFYLEGVGAYSDSWQEFLNFDLKTGELITLNDIIKKEKFSTFKQFVFQKKLNFLKKYKMEMRNSLAKKEITKEEYNWAMQTVNEYCIVSISLQKFILSKSYIRVFDDCEFPHMIRALGPSYELKFKISSIKSFIREDVLKKLTQ